MVKPTFLSLALVLTACFTGCESLHNNARETRHIDHVEIATDPTASYVFFHKQYLGLTPLSIPIDVVPPGSNLIIFKPSFAPISLVTSDVPSSTKLSLTPLNSRYYKLFVAKQIRFVYRQELGTLMIEPYNKVVKVNSSYVLSDPEQGQTIQFIVKSIEDRVLTVESPSGVNLVFPIAYDPEITAFTTQP